MKVGSKLFYGVGVVTFFLVLGLASVYNLLPVAAEEEVAAVEVIALIT